MFYKISLSGARYSTPAKIGIYSDKKISIKMLSMLGQKLGLRV